MAANIKKILIVGDSFSTVWPDGNTGWVNLLAKDYNVTNLSEAGIGEYKILKQLESVNVNNFDVVVVSHTSPSRIHTRNHPLHKVGFRKNCDLILNDLEGHFNPFNINLFISKMFFRYHYDDEYQIDIYKMIREKIKNIINTKYISISHVEIAADLAVEKYHVDFSTLWSKERGYVNHYTDAGNQIVYNTVKEMINND